MRHQKSRHGCCHSSPSGQELVVLAADPGNIGMQKGDQERRIILVEVLYRMKRSKVNELHLLWFHRSTSVCGLNARFCFVYIILKYLKRKIGRIITIITICCHSLSLVG